MARLLGHRARVFVPSGVHPAAVAAIMAEGAQVTEVSGSYDQAVRRAAEAAREPSATLVQDTAWPGYEQVPGWIVEGYSTLFAEIDAQLSDAGCASPGLWWCRGSRRWLRRSSLITVDVRIYRLRRRWP